MPADRFEYGPTFDQVMEALWACCIQYKLGRAHVSVAVLHVDDEPAPETLPLAA